MDKPIQILVVSSELTNCNVLRDIVEGEGWKMLYSSSVGECREVFASQNIDLVFCDRAVRDGTYREVLGIMQSLSLNIRLIVTSRLGDWDEYLEALHDGAFDLIISPSRTADIVRVINQAQSENGKTRTPVGTGNIRMTGAGSALDPPLEMSQNKSIERYPSMTSPIGSSARTSRTEH